MKCFLNYKIKYITIYNVVVTYNMLEYYYNDDILQNLYSLKILTVKNLLLQSTFLHLFGEA